MISLQYTAFDYLEVFLPDTIQLLKNIRIVHSAKELYLWKMHVVNAKGHVFRMEKKSNTSFKRWQIVFMKAIPALSIMEEEISGNTKLSIYLAAHWPDKLLTI